MMFFLGVFVGLWIALVIYGLSHDVKRWLHNWRLQRAFRRLKAEEQARKDLAETFGTVAH